MYISSYTGNDSVICEKYNSHKRLYGIGVGVDFVYVIKNTQSGLYKIGITTNYKRRFLSLKNSSGCNLETIYVIELRGEIDESAHDIEQFIHEYFNKNRVQGEWFRLRDSDLNEIEDLLHNIEGEDIYDEKYKFMVGGYVIG